MAARGAVACVRRPPSRRPERKDVALARSFVGPRPAAEPLRKETMRVAETIANNYGSTG